MQIVTGPDNGFLVDPKPTSLLVQLIDSNGQATAVAKTGFPLDASLNLPQQSGDSVDSIQISGLQQDGSAVVSGTTIPLALDELSGLTLNLFMQRTGVFSRLPSADGGTGELATGVGTQPLLTTLYSRFLLVADGTGSSTGTQLYDTLTWQVTPAPPGLTVAPLSLAYIPSYTGLDAAVEGGTTIGALLTVGKNNAWNLLDLTDSTSADAETYVEAAAPTGAQFSEVAGGQTVVTGTSGPLYVVGRLG